MIIPHELRCVFKRYACGCFASRDQPSLYVIVTKCSIWNHGRWGFKPPRDHLGAPEKNTDLRIWQSASHPLRRIYIFLRVIDLEHLAVTNALGTPSQNMLLWRMFWVRRLGTNCCGKRSGHIDFEHVALASVPDTSAWKILLQLTFWVHRLGKCCCG